MSDLEHELRAARLAAPSAKLERRIDAVFSEAAWHRTVAKNSARSGWLALLTVGATAAVFCVALMVGRGSVPDRDNYRIEARGAMVQLLLGSPGRPNEPLPFGLSIHSP